MALAAGRVDGGQRGADLGRRARLDAGQQAVQPQGAAGQPVFKTTCLLYTSDAADE